MRVNKFYVVSLFMTLCLISVISYFPKPLGTQPLHNSRPYLAKKSDKYFSSFDKKLNLTQDDVNIMYKPLRPRTIYPRRENMEPCKPIFGKVVVFVAYIASSMETHYKVAQESLKCYLKTTNYTVAMVELMTDPKVIAACDHHKQVFFRKHCAAEVYLRESDWLFVLDADTGVANPNHCIEEWIDDRVDIMFYERVFNYEIASGNYIIRNSEFSRSFLKKWSDYEFHQPNNWNGADNGVLQILVLQAAIPDAIQEYDNCVTIWHEGKDYDTYMNYVTCVKLALGSNRVWPGKIRLYRRAHGWVRDGFLTTDKFCEVDFMFHGWKQQVVGDKGWESPFNKNLNPEMCGEGEVGWDWRPGKRTTCDIIKKELANFEKSAGASYPKLARDIAHLRLPDIGLCFPQCDQYT